MGFFEVLGEVGSIIKKPLDLLDDWAREPLKQREHQRSMERKTQTIETKARLENEKQEKLTELEIKRQTEVHRICAEIDELQKDKDFQRHKELSEAMRQYAVELNKLFNETLNNVGNLTIDLQEKAKKLTDERAKKYLNLQDGAHAKLLSEAKKIKEDFADDEDIKNMLLSASMEKYTSLIKNTNLFLEGLRKDLDALTGNISNLTGIGKQFIGNQFINPYAKLAGGAPSDRRLEDKGEIIVAEQA